MSEVDIADWVRCLSKNERQILATYKGDGDEIMRFFGDEMEITLYWIRQMQISSLSLFSSYLAPQSTPFRTKT